MLLVCLLILVQGQADDQILVDTRVPLELVLIK